MPYEKKSLPNAVGNSMPDALKGNQNGCISTKYLGRPGNAKPRECTSGKNCVPVSDWTQDNMQDRRKYNNGEYSKWGYKHDENGRHTNQDYWDRNN